MLLSWFICSYIIRLHYFACVSVTVWHLLMMYLAAFTLAEKSDLLPVSDTDQNLMHACKHKNPHEIRFFRIRSEPFPNVVLNQIHIRYLDIRLTSKHTYPILHRTPNTRATRLLMKVFNAGVLYARILLRWKLYIGQKLHIQELVFNPCPVNFENTTAKSYIIFLSNEVITAVFVIKRQACSQCFTITRSLTRGCVRSLSLSLIHSNSFQ